MDKLRIFQFVETLRIRGNNSGSSTTMTSVSTGPCTGTSWVDCSFRLFGVYVNYSQHRQPNTRLRVTSGVSVVMCSGVSRRYDTVMVDEQFTDKEGFTYIPYSPLILTAGDSIQVNMRKTSVDSANANATIHIGY